MKAVTNMLQHLQHIASTWSRVLPTNAYYKSLGQIGSLSLSLSLPPYYLRNSMTHTS